MIKFHLSLPTVNKQFLNAYKIIEEQLERKIPIWSSTNINKKIKLISEEMDKNARGRFQ
jgi:hypothetical protein